MSPMPNPESVQLQNRTIYDFSGGMVTNYNFYKLLPNQVALIKNADLTRDGSVTKRLGKKKLIPTAIPGNPTVHSLSTIGQNTNADLILATANGTQYEVSTGVINTVKAGLNASALVEAAVLDDYSFNCNGSDNPWMTKGSGATTYRVGIEPVDGVQFAGFSGSPQAGGDATAGNHRFAFRYRSSITGARSKPFITGDVIQSPAAIAIVPGTQTYRMTVGAAMVSADAQVDRIDYFVQEAAALSDAPYYFLGTSGNAAGNYDFGTNVSDNELIVQERLDVDDNPAPTNLRTIESWRGRLLGITGDYTVGYSKQRTDANGFINLPTSWPANNEIEVGFGDGDPLVKVVRFNDYVFAFKRRSIWLLLGDFDSPDFGFKQLKTNHTNTGALNQRSVAQAGEYMFFVSDDLKFHRFGITDFSTEQLRLLNPPLSDPVNDIFSQFASAYRNNINVTNFTFSSYTQVWINFSNGSNGLSASQNFNVFSFDYTTDDAKGGWHIHTGLEIAASVLARDNNRDYYIYSGDYYGYVWQHSVTNGDGAEINGTSTGGNGANTFNDLTAIFSDIVGISTGANAALTFNDTLENFLPGLVGKAITITGGLGAGQTRTISGLNSSTQLAIFPAWGVVPDNTSTYSIDSIDGSMDGVFITIVGGTGVDQVRRIVGIPSSTSLVVSPNWSVVPDNTSQYTIGGIDFELDGRYDWLDDNRPPDFDKYMWYFDCDVEVYGDYGFQVYIVKDRKQNLQGEVVRDLTFSGALWGSGIYGTSIWFETIKDFPQIGLDLLCRQIQCRLINRLAGQPLKINGYTWTYQNLDKVRRT